MKRAGCVENSPLIIIGEYDPILRGEKCWVDQKNKFWTDTMFLFFYVGDAGALKIGRAHV